MAFMQLFSEYGTWYVVESTHGSSVVPADVVNFTGKRPALKDLQPYVEGTPQSFSTKKGWAARYSAPGYMDATEWCGVYKTEEEARAACRDTYGDEDEQENPINTTGAVLIGAGVIGVAALIYELTKPST